ncbi:TIGR00341 family protein [Candidatus Campbellbacteria bacterium]|nr:TIGR00341 family protein [Candidatus Campbellbacteria bacterium]|tara:strand:- start:1361 stop:2110 length:750 start_codon:yes stop_codon:yes gene_type:complete
MYILFHDITESDKTKAIDSLIHDSAPKPSFFFLVIMSVLMASFGLLINNASVIIGSMLIAPILSPILSIALGITLGDNKLISASGYTILKSLFYSISLSALTTWLLWSVIGAGELRDVLNPEILSRIEPNIVYLFIAIVAGLATAYARVKPELNEALPGTAIAVALVPPIATIGIGIAFWNLTIISGALSLFILNAIGIILAAMVMFSLMNIYSKKRAVESALKKVEKEKKDLEKKVQKLKQDEEKKEA